MTLARDIALPPATAVGGGVLASARPLPDGWTRGVEFASEVCLIAGTHQFCLEGAGSTSKDFQGTDTATFDPYAIEVGVACTTLTPIDTRLAQARAALSTVAEFNVGAELATGTASGNPSLSAAASVGSAGSATAALALLEGSIANNLRGHLAWVHAAPQRLTELLAEQAIYLDDLGDWRTASGHLVVSSPGYATPLSDELVATPEVFASVGDVSQIRTVDRSDNRHIALHEAPGLAVFDPCFSVSASITISP